VTVLWCLNDATPLHSYDNHSVARDCSYRLDALVAGRLVLDDLDGASRGYSYRLYALVAGRLASDDLAGASIVAGRKEQSANPEKTQR
jgi:hypothetical protein